MVGPPRRLARGARLTARARDVRPGVRLREGRSAPPPVRGRARSLPGVEVVLRLPGSIFWKMRAGMGEVVFAPLYEALRARGVRFEFFSRVDRLHLSADRRSVAAISVARQARLATGVATYDPLVTVRGLPS